MAEQVVFNEPAEFVPENVGDDDTFQAMATFRFLPPGSLRNNVGLCFALLRSAGTHARVHEEVPQSRPGLRLRALHRIGIEPITQ